jgi:hypothetical protein
MSIETTEFLPCGRLATRHAQRMTRRVGRSGGSAWRTGERAVRRGPGRSGGRSSTRTRPWVRPGWRTCTPASARPMPARRKTALTSPGYVEADPKPEPHAARGTASSAVRSSAAPTARWTTWPAAASTCGLANTTRRSPMAYGQRGPPGPVGSESSTPKQIPNHKRAVLAFLYE